MVANQEVGLSATERRLARAFAEGQALDLMADADDGPQNVSSWGPERQIRADVIAGLLTGAALPTRSWINPPDDNPEKKEAAAQ